MKRICTTIMATLLLLVSASVVLAQEDAKVLSDNMDANTSKTFHAYLTKGSYNIKLETPSPGWMGMLTYIAYGCAGKETEISSGMLTAGTQTLDMPITSDYMFKIRSDNTPGKITITIEPTK